MGLATGANGMLARAKISTSSAYLRWARMPWIFGISQGRASTRSALVARRGSLRRSGRSHASQNVRGPRWGRIEAPGLGVEVDEKKLARYHQDYLDHGEFPPYCRSSSIAASSAQLTSAAPARPPRLDCCRAQCTRLQCRFAPPPSICQCRL